jgi:hypothetical protein
MTSYLLSKILLVSFTKLSAPSLYANSDLSNISKTVIGKAPAILDAWIKFNPNPPEPKINTDSPNFKSAS